MTAGNSLKVLLCDPQGISARLDNTKRFPNYGLLSLAGYAREKAPFAYFKYLTSSSMKNFRNDLLDYRPEVVGISFSSLFRREAFETIETARKICPDALIISGGAHSTVDPEDVLNNSRVDIAVVGEGEQPFVRLLKWRMNRSEPLEEIPGLAFRDKKGKTVRTPVSPFCDLEILPIPAWDLIDPLRFSGQPPSKKSPASMVVVTRGCPFNCVFCSNPVWRSSLPRVRRRAPGQVMEEIQFLTKKGVREIRLGGDELNPVSEWAYELLACLKSSGKDLPYFSCNLIVDKVDDKLARLLKESNFWMVNLGIESFQNRVLNGIRKKITRTQIDDAVNCLKRHNIRVFGNLMMYNVWENDGSLEFQTHEEVDEDIRIARGLIIKNKLDYMSWSFATPIPGSELWEIARRHGLLCKDETKHPCDRTWNSPLDLPGMEKGEMIKRRNRGFRLQFLAYFLHGGVDIRYWRRAVNKLSVMISPDN